MAGPAMPMLESSVAMITSQQPRRAALPAKHRPETTPTSGTSPLSRPNRAKAITSSPDTWGAGGVTGPPTSAFGEEHDAAAGSRSASSNSRSFLRWP